VLFEADFHEGLCSVVQAPLWCCWSYHIGKAPSLLRFNFFSEKLLLCLIHLRNDPNQNTLRTLCKRSLCVVILRQYCLGFDAIRATILVLWIWLLEVQLLLWWYINRIKRVVASRSKRSLCSVVQAPLRCCWSYHLGKSSLFIEVQLFLWKAPSFAWSISEERP